MLNICIYEMALTTSQQRQIILIKCFNAMAFSSFLFQLMLSRVRIHF